MNEYRNFNYQLPTPKLDPLHVGEIMGSDAFSIGDWVLLRIWENKPVKVTSLDQGLIFIDQAMEEGFENTLVYFYPEELGYPLDHRFWSSHQSRCYLRCHYDRKLLKRRQKMPKVLAYIASTFEPFLVGGMVSVFALMILGYWLYEQVFGRLVSAES